MNLSLLRVPGTALSTENPIANRKHVPALTEHPLHLGEENNKQENRVGEGIREGFLLRVKLLGKVSLVGMAPVQVPERSEGVSLWLRGGGGGGGSVAGEAQHRQRSW